MPLKIGDIILIDFGETQKNNFRPFYQIVKSPGYRSGINWHDRLISTKKMGVNSNKVYLWNLDWIREISDGSARFNPDKMEKEIQISAFEKYRESYGQFSVSKHRFNTFSKTYAIRCSSMRESQDSSLIGYSNLPY